MKTKTIGREPSCDLVLEHPTVSRWHARIELGEDGLVRVRNCGARNVTLLKRNDSWIRVGQVTLCSGDSIRFGEQEVPLDRLVAVFGRRSRARLEKKHLPLPRSGERASGHAGATPRGSRLQKPRRNPATGKIEEGHAAKAGAGKSNTTPEASE